MRKTLVITDVTQMPQWNQVCVVGITDNGECIRPVCEGGFQKDYLIQNRLTIIRPAAKVEFDLKVIEIQPPHIEDMDFDPSSITGKGFCTSVEWDEALQQTSFNTVEEIYEGHLKGHDWLLPGTNTRSIATLSGASIIDIELTEKSIKPRITFLDSSGHEYCRPASDLTLWNRCYFQVKKQGENPIDVAKELVIFFQKSNRLYLRLGLARPWTQPGSSDPKCYLQVTGIYTFPDYLQGKPFADFLV